MTLVGTETKRGGGSACGVVPLEITVLAGGPGPEREVSEQSGRAVCEALRRLGHRVLLRDIGPEDLSALDEPADIVFIALHGEFGEDGTLQTELDRRGIRFCGSGASASRLAMDKVGAKRRFEETGIPTPPYVLVDGSEALDRVDRLEPPVVVKPTGSGSSVDTSIVSTRGEARRCAQGLLDKYGSALIERYIRGPELTVGILGEQPLPVCEIRTRRAFYDYQAKYLDDDTQYLFELEVPNELIERVQKLSVAAHRALGCRVFSRVDWMVDAATMSPFVLEINTIPGFTSHSLLPKAAARAGISFDALCQRIVELSIAGSGGR